MDKTSYDAYALNQKIKGKSVLSLEELILNSMQKGQLMKREEIIENVSRNIGGSYDLDLAPGVSNILRKLKKCGLVKNSKPGYWEKV